MSAGLIIFSPCILQLRNYASYIDGKPTAVGTAGGYSVKWDPDQEREFRRDTKKSEIIIPATLIPVAFFVGFCGGVQALQFFCKHVNKSKGGYAFYIFWSFQFLAALINGLHTWYVPELPIVITIPVSALIYSVIVVSWCNYEIEFEVPCNEFVCDYWRRFMCVFAAWNTFVFFIYMAYTLPWIILGFYLYPIKILVRVSAILAAGLSIIANFYIILLYFEKWIAKCECINSCTPCFVIHVLQFYLCCNCCSRLKDCCVCCWSKMKTCCIVIAHCDCLNYWNNYRHIADNDNDNEWKVNTKCTDMWCCNNCVVMYFRNNWDAYAALSRCATGILVFFCLGCMGYLLHHIIFVFTNEVRTAVIELLHIIPLIVLSLGAYMIRNLLKLTPVTKEEDSTSPYHLLC